MSKVRVLLVDDSKVMRTILHRLLHTDPEIEIVAEASDPYEAREAIVRTKPDVMILDVHMPKMDGITFLKKVMASYPVRTLMYSSFTTKNSKTLLEAVSAGAIDVLEKPGIQQIQDFETHGQALCKRVRAVASANLVKGRVASENPSQKKEVAFVPAEKVIAIAASTGGTEALKLLLPQLKAPEVGILIVQHLPDSFVIPFVELLDALCSFPVRIAQNGETVCAGVALVAPGGSHMEVASAMGKLIIRLTQSPPIFGIRPAADNLLRSVATAAGKNATGIILTGMGKDGAQGLLEMKQAGSYNIAQDEASCVVFGMPKEAIRLGAIDSVLPLDSIALEALEVVKKRKAA